MAACGLWATLSGRSFAVVGLGTRAPLAVEGGVRTVAGDEVFVRAVLDQAAVVDHEDAVGVLGSAQAVRDHDACSAFEQAPDRSVDHPLGLGVER